MSLCQQSKRPTLDLDSLFPFQRIRNPTPSHEGDHFQKIQTGSWFLGLRWLDPALDFPIGALDTIQSSVKPEHSRTPSLPQGVLGNCGAWDTLSLTENLLLSFLRVFA
jgi:hypothetical protein